LEILGGKSLFGIDLDLKMEVLRTLAKTGRPEFLPHLERLLKSRYFLFRRDTNRFKAEVLRSLEGYPTTEAIFLLERFSGSSDPILADLASRGLKNFRKRTIP
jgi:hypothetical protein